MLSRNKSIAIASAVLLASLLLGTATQAGLDDNAQRRTGSAVSERFASIDALKLRPGYDMARSGVDTTVTASIAPNVETTVPFRRSAPNYNVFKSVVVPVGELPAFSQWSTVRPSAGTFGAVCGAGGCGSKGGRKLVAAIEKARGLSELEAIRLINVEVNRVIAYRDDKGDDWQTMAQSLARGTGDCEDYVIAKMTMLAALGFPPERMQFVVLRETRRQIYHAVLAVHVNGKRYILDNLSNTAATDDIFRTYKPIVSLVGAKSYVHGFKGGEKAVAMKGGYSSIRLGGN